MAIRKQIVSLACWMFVLACALGCSNEERRYSVTGTVKFQGQPVNNGQILFAADDSGDAGVGKIENGKYSLQTTAGEKTVRISATQETGRFTEGGMGAKVPELIDIIPPKYNTASGEKRKVEAKNGQTIDFDLQ
ncbi:hypothetical protein NA78x_003345 [Anatilimnocola sp. NA78]|uniref:hypothetical protein n=1 Tax=Anatilimnocola sp. NA78 TaxID=3415683 RepID=UPI003CE55EFC